MSQNKFTNYIYIGQKANHFKDLLFSFTYNPNPLDTSSYTVEGEVTYNNTDDWELYNFTENWEDYNETEECEPSNSSSVNYNVAGNLQLSNETGEASTSTL